MNDIHMALPVRHRRGPIDDSCTCPRTTCGGVLVAPDVPVCPWHDLGEAADWAAVFHRADTCPATRPVTVLCPVSFAELRVGPTETRVWCPRCATHHPREFLRPRDETKCGCGHPARLHGPRYGLAYACPLATCTCNTTPKETTVTDFIKFPAHVLDLVNDEDLFEKVADAAHDWEERIPGRDWDITVYATVVEVEDE